MTHLYSPLTIKGVTLRNRIGVSPMCQYSAEDGFANDWHLVHLGSRAVGGAGLIFAEATAVEARGRISPQDVGLWKDEHIEFQARITRFIKAQGGTPAVQLAHAGRKGSTYQPWQAYLTTDVPDDEGGWQVVGSSAIPFSENHRIPHELTVPEIKAIQQCFKAAAVRALEAGYEVLEVHSAHGYLLHSFNSPISNHRTDEYGGSLENRTRFLVETVQEVRSVVPDNLVLVVRLSATDWLEGGWTIDDSVEVSRRLKSEGVDLIDCSSGGILPEAPIPVGAGYQVPLSEQIRQQADIATATVGLITEPMQADMLIRNGQADIVLLGRELLRNPYWGIDAASVLHQDDEAAIPKQYLRAY